MTKENIVIKVENLTKHFKVKEKQVGFKNKFASFFKPKYKVVKAVDDVSFEVKEGESLALIGPNGAGKSTTIKMLTGILYPTSGSLQVLGLNPTKEKTKLSYQIGTVFGQKEQLWVHLTPMENFKFFGAIYNIKKNILKERIDELCKIFEVEGLLNQTVRSLSLGQRMKCEMIASLLHKPKMLFFDEPTIGLDIIAKETLRTLIKKINKELKTTIIFTSHDMSDIEEVCNRVIVINNGKIVLDDSVKNLKYNFFKEKIVEVKLKKPCNLKEKDGITISEKNSDKTGYKILVDLTKCEIADAIKLFDGEDILDINILSTPLEKVIKEIYKGNK